MLILLIAGAWVVCAVATYFLAVHRLQAIWTGMPDSARERLPDHRRQARFIAAFGPFGLIAVSLQGPM